MKKIHIIFLTLFVAFLSCTGNAFSASWDTAELPTVRQMQENINTLQQEKALLEFKWDSFRVGDSSLRELIKTDLLESEQQALFTIVEEYNTQKTLWENILRSIVDNKWDETAKRRELILLKKSFYTDITPFISQQKLESFLNYISTDISLNEKSKDVDSQIWKIQNSKQERVQVIQEKIENNNKILRESIELKITTEVRNKLDEFTTKWEFSQLDNTVKIEIFNRVIKKLEYESIRLINLQNATSVIEEKIVVFRVMINLLKEYTSAWAQ